MAAVLVLGSDEQGRLVAVHTDGSDPYQSMQAVEPQLEAPYLYVTEGTVPQQLWQELVAYSRKA